VKVEQRGTVGGRLASNQMLKARLQLRDQRRYENPECHAHVILEVATQRLRCACGHHLAHFVDHVTRRAHGFAQKLVRARVLCCLDEVACDRARKHQDRDIA
jgi:hypothetical protein